MKKTYITRKNDIVYVNDNLILTNKQILDAVMFSNNAMSDLYNQTIKFDINIFEVLGMRNLSGLVGEYLSRSLQRFSNGSLQSNLHQDGYPDLLLTNTIEQKNYFESLYTTIDGKKFPHNKSDFSPFKFGGIEVKATCGSTPSANQTPKPLIGQTRITLLKSFDWKAHHRETNNLIGILWDFIDFIPTVVAVFYSNELTIEDWGKIVKPKTDGGRTTSVSIMKKSSVKKMCKNWVIVLNDETYIQTLSKDSWIGYRVTNNY